MARMIHKETMGKLIYNNGRFDNKALQTLGVNYYLNMPLYGKIQGRLSESVWRAGIEGYMVKKSLKTTLITLNPITRNAVNMRI